MSGIDWRGPNFNGDFFEVFFGCLLGNRFPESVRVRPARGDGGVDIFVFVGEDEVDVYQLKHFRDAIRWEQVERSLDHLSDGEWRGRRVRDWHLVVPQQPTVSSDPELETQWVKFEEVTASAPFACRWFGEDRLHALAADFPQVRDYYLGDGKKRLLRLVEDWQNATTQIAAEQAPSGELIAERLSELVEALDHEDPHFRYAIQISPVEPTSFDSRALVHTVIPVGERFYTQSVFERYRGAAELASERLAMVVSVRDGDAAKALQQMMDFGGFEPVTLGPEDLVEFDPPDAARVTESNRLGQTYVQARPNQDLHPPRDLLVMVTSDRGTNSSFAFKGDAVSRGDRGMSLRWLSPGKRLAIEVELESESTTSRVFVRPTSRFAGLSAHEFGADVDFFAHMARGTKMRLLDAVRKPILELELGEHRPIKPLDAALIAALLVVQAEASTEILFPSAHDPSELKELIRFACLLRGVHVTERIESWSATFASENDVPQLDCPFALTRAEGLDELELVGQQIVLRHTFNRAVMTRASHVGEIAIQGDGSAVADFVVGTFDVSVARRLAPEEIGPQFPTDELIHELGAVKHKTVPRLVDELVASWLRGP